MEITTAQATRYLLSLHPPPTPSNSDNHLNPRIIDIAFYDPIGTYLVPVREILLSSSTSLSGLVLELQSLLNQNLEELNVKSRNRNSQHVDKKYLVYSIQIRMHSAAEFLTCPKITGELNFTIPSTTAESAEYVQWLCNKGEMEIYWDVYRRTILLGENATGVKNVMLKVRTVRKLESPLEHLLGGGGHTFITAAEEAEPLMKPTPTVVVEEVEDESEMKTPMPEKQKGKQKEMKKVRDVKDLNTEDLALLNSVMAAFNGKDSETVSQKDILAAVLSGKAQVAEKKEAQTDTQKASNEELNRMMKQGGASWYGLNEQETQDVPNGKYNNLTDQQRKDLRKTDLYKSYAKTGAKILKDQGKSASKLADPKRTWKYWQNVANPEGRHPLCDLSRHPYELEDMPPAGYYDIFHDPASIPTADQMLSWDQLPASVTGVFVPRTLSPREAAEVQIYAEMKERAISFEDDDDQEFFPAGNGPLYSHDHSPATDFVTPAPINLGRRSRSPRIDTDSILSSVHLRKGAQGSHLSGLNRPMSPSPLQNMTNVHSHGVISAAHSESLGYSHPQQSSDQGFYDVNYTGQAPEDWQNQVNELQGQNANSGYYNANNMASLNDFAPRQNQNQRAKGYKSRNASRNTSLASNPVMQLNDNVMVLSNPLELAQALASDELVQMNFADEDDQQPQSALLGFSNMQSNKNPALGSLNSFNQPIVAGTTATAPAYTQRTQPGNNYTPSRTFNASQQRMRGAMSTPRGIRGGRVVSGLRAESPAFKMNPRRAPAGSQTNSNLSSGLAAGFAAMEMKGADAAAEKEEQDANTSFESGSQ